MVAPHAGAWIEILKKSPRKSVNSVAPHAGAWIEMNPKYQISLLIAGSHPTRVRGLKCVELAILFGAALSHPTRVRGLKFYRIFFYNGF